MARTIPVEIEHLTVRFGSVRAVDDLSLAIEPGEILALLGPSGCGKTTTLRVMSGLLSADAGSVRFGGQAVDRLPPHRRNVGIVFQNYALFPHMSVFENIRFGLQMHGVPRAEQGGRVERALDLLQIREHAEKFPDQLSGGQQQRVALARTMVVEPDLVLLDEPLSALDRKLRDQMRVEIRDLLKRLAVTSVIVTHDQEEALTMADRVAVMRAGRIEQIGTPHEIYHRPRTRFVADFIGQSNHLHGTVTASGARQARVAIAPGVEVGAETEEAVGDGAAVDLVVRPEAIAVRDGEAGSTAPDGGVNRLAGRMVREVFTGEKVLVYVRPDGAAAEGGEIVAAEASSGSAAGTRPADAPVILEWPIAATRIVS